MNDTNAVLLWVLGGALILAALIITVVVVRGRPLAGENVFRASRWSRGNHLFPTQVMITPDSVVHCTPQWVGKREQSIHMAHVAIGSTTALRRRLLDMGTGLVGR